MSDLHASRWVIRGTLDIAELPPVNCRNFQLSDEDGSRTRVSAGTVRYHLLTNICAIERRPGSPYHSRPMDDIVRRVPLRHLKMLADNRNSLPMIADMPVS